MTLTLNKYAPVILLPIIVALCIGLWLIQVTPLEKIDSDTGTYDLREIDFSKTIANVTRTVEYIPDELLTPEQFTERKDILVGTIPEDTLVCTMRIRLLLPDDQQYGLCGYSVNYASTVYVNGKWLFTEGTPGFSLDEETGQEGYHLFSAEPHDGEVEILIATSSFSHEDTISGMEWCIGEYQNVRNCYTRYIFVPIVVMAWYLLLAVVFFLLFLTLPEYSANGWLTLLSLVSAIRTGFTHSKPLLSLFPALDWSIGFRIEKIAGPAIAALLVLVFHSVFKGAFPKWLRGILIGICGILCVPYLLMDTRTLSQFSAGNRLLVYLLMAVTGALVLLSLRKTRPNLPQWITLVGIGLVLFSAVWDISYYGENPFGLLYSLMQPILVVFSMFMLVSAMLITIQKTVDAESEASRLRIEMLEQETETANARTATMLSQIQPHFLYNALNSIDNLFYVDPEKAHDALYTFSDYLRGNMDSLEKKGAIPFEKELEHTRQYLHLEKLRFKERLHIEYDIPVEAFDLPVLTLQPIVENAVRHGVTKKREGGVVSIRTEEAASCWRVTVTDNGIGFDPVAPVREDGRSHTGIANVRHRLASICGGRLTIHSVPSEGTTAVIEIPKSGRAEHEHHRG